MPCNIMQSANPTARTYPHLEWSCNKQRCRQVASCYVTRLPVACKLWWCI